MNMGKTNKCNLKEDDTSEKVVKKYQWSGPFRKGILLHLHMPTHRQKHLINRMCKSTTNQLLIAYFDYTFILDDCLCLIKICAYSHITIIKACVRFFRKFWKLNPPNQLPPPFITLAGGGATMIRDILVSQLLLIYQEDF